jgi:hypothetical protein
MDFQHEDCGGLIETLDPENYGMCTVCGAEGYFKVIREEEGAVYVIFYKPTCVRTPPQ